ncbi:hypothetical protein SO3561_09522 [Streptomyces olivochromogenes]|uniref:Uncharacterized protein n=1 Tax=Streptomyces olivochromogenes TaxID=1963 RepID=A0A250VUZ2_STROL|nr:hypothetical protein SO3561_09522 [Streptomyces olivochromogenes]
MPLARRSVRLGLAGVRLAMGRAMYGRASFELLRTRIRTQP